MIALDKENLYCWKKWKEALLFYELWKQHMHMKVMETN